MTGFELSALKEAMKKGYFTCFRTGVWTDSGGKQHDITQGDLDTIASQYEKRMEESKNAPLLFGHYGKEEKGKIAHIMRYGDYLLAKAVDIKDNMLKKIKDGAIKFVSIAMDPQYEIEHIALTNTPAVEGLLPLQGAFSTATSPESMLFQFELVPAAGKNNENQLIFPVPDEEQEQEYQPKNQQKKEVKMPDDEIKEGKDKKESPPGSAAAGAAEFERKLSLAEKEKADALRAAEEARTKLAEFEAKQKTDRIATFCAEKVLEGKLFPNEVEPMSLFLSMLDGKTHQFSKEKSLSPFDYMTGFLSGLPKRIPLDKIDVKKQTTGNGNACFSRLTNPDEEDLAKHEKALAVMKEMKISYAAALAQLD